MPATQTPHFDKVPHSASSSDISLSGEIGAHRNSSVSDCLSEVDLESGALDMEVHLDNKTHRDCRICHLGLETSEEECGGAIELGCSCKGDLGAAHKKCAETWFKIRVVLALLKHEASIIVLRCARTCEICGATALGVAGEQTIEAHNASAAVLPAPAGCMNRMAANNVGLPAGVSKEQAYGMAATEMEYRVELFNRLLNTCFNKCIDKRHKDAELNMGENSCVDRCVSKYWAVNGIIGQMLSAGQHPM
ncbi:hypothetical protein SADUNF_Sadunf16G0136700 [Salix dunnii]|uniref:RING-CH-type domain-containing protein n=1 Tax=Salix dunnii TaxID=1413687 RepID=A0A835MJ18_9ROSI|nr:hypothetical protein SADUNF_Sadunf16G0136700 [Salix dunnii]